MENVLVCVECVNNGYELQLSVNSVLNQDYPDISLLCYANKKSFFYFEKLFESLNFYKRDNITSVKLLFPDNYVSDFYPYIMEYGESRHINKIILLENGKQFNT